MFLNWSDIDNIFITALDTVPLTSATEREIVEQGRGKINQTKTERTKK